MYELTITNKNYSSWSLRAWLLLAELGIPFEERLVTFRPAAQGLSFAGVTPSGRVPCLRDGDVVVWDSFAITEYVAEQHAGVWPGDRVARAWARCAAAEMHSGFAALRTECSMNCGLRVRLSAPSAQLHADVARIEELWADGLARWHGPFLAGKTFTAVDAFFAPIAYRAQGYGLALGAQAQAYVQRLLALPAMQRWYAAALAEPDRDDAHEAEAKRSGTILEDLRR